MFQTLFSFIDAFIITTVDDEERRAEFEPIIAQRGNILRVASTLASTAAESLNGYASFLKKY